MESASTFEPWYLSPANGVVNVNLKTLQHGYDIFGLSYIPRRLPITSATRNSDTLKRKDGHFRNFDCPLMVTFYGIEAMRNVSENIETWSIAGVRSMTDCKRIMSTKNSWKCIEFYGGAEKCLWIQLHPNYYWINVNQKI